MYTEASAVSVFYSDAATIINQFYDAEQGIVQCISSLFIFAPNIVSYHLEKTDDNRRCFRNRMR